MGSIDERMGANEAFGQAPARLWANRPIIYCSLLEKYGTGLEAVEHSGAALRGRHSSPLKNFL